MPLKLYPRKNGIYHIRGTVQGQRIDQSARTRSRKEAEQIRAKLEADAFKAHVYGARSVATFADAVVDYLSAGGEAEHLDPLLDAFGTKLLSEVTQSELDKLAKGRNVAPSTVIRQIYTPAAAVLNFAASDAGGKLCDRVQFKKPKVRNARTEFLTPDEAEAWLTGPMALPPYLARLVTFYLGTGCRASEALGQTWRDLKPDRTIFQDTKENYARGIDLQKRVKAVLGDPGASDAPIFVNSRGDPWHGYDAINLVLKKHRLKHPKLRAVHCHLFRHTWATWAYACTRDLTFLMQSGGWRSPTMVMRYAHAASDDLARSVLAKGWEFQGRERIGTKPKRPKS